MPVHRANYSATQPLLAFNVSCWDASSALLLLPLEPAGTPFRLMTSAHIK